MDNRYEELTFADSVAELKNGFHLAGKNHQNLNIINFLLVISNFKELSFYIPR